MSKPQKKDEDNDGGGGASSSEGILLQQTLMSHNECFLYKVPPLATADGYRANEWNLAQPLKECGLQVERRNNDLYLLFTLENHTRLFALSKIDGKNPRQSIETVLDSSRYFVTKIQSSNSRTALIGFGFRDRDIALDLLGNLQQFQNSIEREIEASKLKDKLQSIPILAKGEKIHINIPGKSKKVDNKPKKKNSTNTSGGGGFLLKKPPPGADATPISTTSSASAVPSLTIPTTPPLKTTACAELTNASSSMPSPPLSIVKNENKKDLSRQFSMSSMECPLVDMTLSVPAQNNDDARLADNADDDEENSDAAIRLNKSVANSIDTFSTGGFSTNKDSNGDSDDDFGDFQDGENVENQDKTKEEYKAPVKDKSSDNDNCEDENSVAAVGGTTLSIADDFSDDYLGKTNCQPDTNDDDKDSLDREIDEIFDDFNLNEDNVDDENEKNKKG